MALLLSAAPLRGQAPASCGISGRIGGAVPTDEVRRVEPFREEGIVTGEVLEAGLALGAGRSCPLAGPWTLGAGVERLDLGDVAFWHLTGSAGARTAPAPGLVLSARLRAGWRIAHDDRVFESSPPGRATEERTETEPVLVFPITGGLTVRL